MLPLVKNGRQYKYDTHCPSECVNGVEIVAEETTPRHLSGGDKPEEGMPDMFVGASYAGAAAIAKNLC